MFGQHKNFSQFLHNRFIHNRRINILEDNIGRILPKDIKNILDIGCGDGLISSILQKKHSYLKIQGLEVLKRNDCLIPCRYFNGKKIPFRDKSFDLCMLIDVLHHTLNIQLILNESVRVSKKYILIKDHVYLNSIEFFILKFMDWVGNKPYGVRLVYNYQKREEWKKLFQNNKLKIIIWKDELPLYSTPFKYIFGRKMHFMVLLKKANV